MTSPNFPGAPACSAPPAAQRAMTAQAYRTPRCTRTFSRSGRSSTLWTGGGRRQGQAGADCARSFRPSRTSFARTRSNLRLYPIVERRWASGHAHPTSSSRHRRTTFTRHLSAGRSGSNQPFFYHRHRRPSCPAPSTPPPPSSRQTCQWRRPSRKMAGPRPVGSPVEGCDTHRRRPLQRTAGTSGSDSWLPSESLVTDWAVSGFVPDHSGYRVYAKSDLSKTTM